MAATKPQGVCPECGRRGRVTKSGRMYPHGAASVDGVKPWPPRQCPGTGSLHRAWDYRWAETAGIKPT